MGCLLRVGGSLNTTAWAPSAQAGRRTQPPRCPCVPGTLLEVRLPEVHRSGPASREEGWECGPLLGRRLSCGALPLYEACRVVPALTPASCAGSWTEVRPMPAGPPTELCVDAAVAVSQCGRKVRIGKEGGMLGLLLCPTTAPPSQDRLARPLGCPTPFSGLRRVQVPLPFLISELQHRCPSLQLLCLLFVLLALRARVPGFLSWRGAWQHCGGGSAMSCP